LEENVPRVGRNTPMILRRIVCGMVAVAGVVPGTGVAVADPRKSRNTLPVDVKEAFIPELIMVGVT
jgi:hypothetical protein